MPLTMSDLEAIVAARALASPDESWTAKLIADGPDRCARKFGEEAVELVIAATKGERPEIVAESADVLFHLLVLLKARGVTLDEVMAELDRRSGQSGLAEKAQRDRK